ncbi:hypothetical protein PLESTB_000501300 [Pleodorina starrii]|uniref:Uncharacterized protein n=1 Tax=Pleodorina starrii TaxID=330485 RepID=A0A9W6BH01_9CHLO|nr:hypothetical protein PLESTM_001775300 [Pleodorina starrii]GLC51427.1 hypothetical protein PLESTB_000501300 [Pleodorina starrii]GLC67756.1 hypothetical protein PLESTF_000602200 [Pleodorina starrii]
MAMTAEEIPLVGTGATFVIEQTTSDPNMKFRPAGAPAGAWHHTPWYHCTFFDPYERINVWSHGLPALAFVVLGALAKAGVVPGGLSMSVFCFCAAMTHGSSTLTHVWPDDHVLEKIDHLCIPFLIIGVPLTAVMALRPSGPYHVMAAMAVVATLAAFLPPLYRTLAFVASGAVLFGYYFWIVDWNILTQVVLQVAGGVFFVRNGGHSRPTGLQDHHMLHYCVTSACILHVVYIIRAVQSGADKAKIL